MQTALIFIVLVLSSVVHADPLGGSLEIGTSTSGSYEARNVFVQPAALAFDTALNGAEISTSMNFGTGPNGPDDYSFAFAWGYLGFGAERFDSSALSRYSFVLAAPLTSKLFFGARWGLYRYDTLGGGDSLDFGLQYRPDSRFSFGLLVNQANQPRLGGVAMPILTTLSTTVRPVRSVDLTVDATTDSNQFLRTFTYQATASFQIIEGVRFRVGYHSSYQWLAGLQIHFGNASLFSSVQPTSAGRSITVGVQSSTTPYRSSLFPTRSIKMSLGSSLSEERVEGGLLSFARPSLLKLLSDLEEIENDSSVDEVLIQLEEFPLGLASAHEVHMALQRLKASGKTIDVFLGHSGIKEYLIASAATRVFIEPAGEIRWLGLRSERYFLKGTLDKIGVEGEFLAAGKYKAAPEMFTRKSSSEPARTAALEEMRSAEETLLKILENSSRKIDGAKWKRLLDLGLLSAHEAKKEGLVDGLVSYASVLAVKEKRKLITPVIPLRKDNLRLPHRIAVVVARGNILPNKNRWLTIGGTEQLTPSNMEKKLRQAQQDPRTKAVLMRVSSPGGEVLASQQIATTVEEVRSTKPLFVSMGDVAASGGYYIAAPSGRIFAGPMTITGSIGVFLGKFNLAGLFKLLDVHKEIMGQGPYPGLYSEDRPWTKAEKAVMERRLDSYYGDFVDYVAKTRHLERKVVESAAQGRVWTGKQAKKAGLVDELGGYYEALRFAASETGLEPGEYEIWEIESGSNLLEMLSMDAWSKSARERTSAPYSLLSPEALDALGWASTVQETPFLYLSPRPPPDA